MKLHEFAALAIVITVVGWLGMVALMPQGQGAQNALGGAFGQNSIPLGTGAAAQNNVPLAAGTNGVAGSGAAIADTALGGVGQKVTIPIKVRFGYYEPREIRVKEGTQVRLELDRPTFTGCMTIFNIWGLGVKQNAQENNIVEFTADKPGTYKTSCPMGMGDGKFIVVATDGSTANAQEAPKQAVDGSTAQLSGPTGTACGMGSGCGCGG